MKNVLWYIQQELQKDSSFFSQVESDPEILAVISANQVFQIRHNNGIICLYQFSCLIWKYDINQI